MKTLGITITLLFALTSASASNYLPTHSIVNSTIEAVAAKRSSAATKAMSKLSASEVSAIVSMMADAQKLGSRPDKEMAAQLAKLRKVLAMMENHPKFQKAKWMAADGSTFDSYGEYHEYQWGRPAPGGGSPW